MNNRNKYILAIILTWSITMIPSFYFLNRQLKENNIVNQYLSLNNFLDVSINKNSAIQISDQVRKDFNRNESSFVALDMHKRPFLREDVGFLLTHKEGLCGEGTRVIVNLLNRLGYDATRITLYNRKLQSSHTLVSLVIDEQELLLDSINSAERFNILIKKLNISPKDFNLMHYSHDVAKRRSFAKTEKNNNKSKEHAQFFNHYWLYSYETIPYSKLLTKIGLDVRVFNFKRPPQWLSTLAEKPNLIMLIITLIVSVVTTYLLHKFRIIRKIFRIKKT